MNMIPMILVLISILSLLSFSSFSSTKDLNKKSSTAIGYLKAQRLLASKTEIYHYKKAQRVKNESSSKPQIKEKRKIFRSNSPSPFFLRLLSSKEHEKLFFPVFQKLLTSIYSHHPTFSFLKNPQDSDRFCLLILEKIRSKKPHQALSMMDLCPTQAPFEELFYKMAKGTHIYTLGGAGYPPLEKIFSLDLIGSTKLSNFGQIPPFFLSAIFGEKIARAILQKENELSKLETRHYIPLSEEELLSIFNDYPTDSFACKGLIEHLEFKKKPFSQKHLEVIEPHTHIVLSLPKD